MASVNFTLEDVRVVVTEVVTEVVTDKVAEIVEEVVDRKLSQHFASFIEHNLDPALKDIDGQFKSIRRITRKHSADIAELQAVRGV